MLKFTFPLIIFLVSFAYAEEFPIDFSIKEKLESIGLKGDLSQNFEELESSLQKDSGENIRSKKSIFLPFELSNGDMLKVKIATSAAVVLFLTDEDVMDFVQKNKGSVSDKLTYFGDNFGAYSGPALVAGTYIWGIVAGNDNLRRYVRIELTSLIAAGIITQALKNVFGRARPHHHLDNPYDFYLFESSPNHQSFPSGHATEAFVVATLVAEANKDKSTMIPILAYGAAAVTAYARVKGKNHWASDTIIGGLIGHIVTKAVLGAETAKKGFLISPSMTEEGTFTLQILYTGRPKDSKESCAEGLDQREAMRVCLEKVFESSFNK